MSDLKGLSRSALERRLTRLSSVEHIARVCHEAVRGYARALGELGMLQWEQASPDARDAAIRFVKKVVASPDAGPADLVPNWLDLPPEQQARSRILVSIVRAMQE